MGQKLCNIHWLVDKTMSMCESFLTKTYLEIPGASSCRCIGIAGRVRYNRGSFTRVLEKSFVICYCHVGRGHNHSLPISNIGDMSYLLEHLIEECRMEQVTLATLIRDDYKIPDYSGEAPKTKWRGWQFNS